MKSLNEISLIGFIGNDPEFLNFDNGGCLCKFSLATSFSYKKKETNEKVEVTDWHNILVKNKGAEIVNQYAKKGHKIYIKGMLRSRSYEDKDGQIKYVSEVHVADFIFLEKS